MQKEIVLNIMNNEIPLAKECWNCHDNEDTKYGRLDKTPKSMCLVCGGKGIILTDNGNAIKNLFHHCNELFYAPDLD